jgi:hypothetical protein
VLIPELRKRNVGFTFIGPNQDAVSAHAGYGGKNTRYLLSISKDVYSRYPADIVMIHSCHNSFSKYKPVPGIIRDTEAMIDNIREINPGVIVLLAQVIPSGKLPKYTYIPKLNKEFSSLLGRLNKQWQSIILVNQAEAFHWKTDTVNTRYIRMPLELRKWLKNGLMHSCPCSKRRMQTRR